MATSTTSTNSSNLPVEFYERKLLDTLEERVVLQPLGMAQSLPKNNGKLVKWLRYASIDGSTTALTEGTVPSEIGFTTSNVTSTIAQYGQYAKVSDLLDFTAIDPVIKNLSVRFGYAAAKTIEQLIVNELDAEAAVQRINNRANDAAIVAGDVLSHLELIEAMIEQKADFIGPHESGDYIAVCSPLSEYDLLVDQQDGAWLDINKRTSEVKKVMNGEFGRMYGMRFLTSDLMTTEADAGSGGTVDVVSNYVIGQQAFGTVSLEKGMSRMIIKPVGSAGALDPLDQFSTVGYKIMGYATKYLDSGSKRVIRLKGAAALGDNA